MNDCLFCKIVKGDIPSYKVYEDDKCIAFLDISQATIGHTLIVPKEHYANFLEIPEELLAHLSIVAKKIATSISYIKGVKGFNIINNCNEVSGQAIMHFHIHVIPRYTKDELIIKQQENKLTDQEFNKLVNSIKNNL